MRSEVQSILRLARQIFWLTRRLFWSEARGAEHRDANRRGKCIRGLGLAIWLGWSGWLTLGIREGILGIWTLVVIAITVMAGRWANDCTMRGFDDQV
jgi:hypothetical protein